MQEETKRHFTPWLLKSSIRQQLGSKPKRIRAQSKDSFLVEVRNKQHEIITSITELNGKAVTITEYTDNKYKGLIYIYQYNMDDFEKFKERLKEEHNICNATLASWIKPRTPFKNVVLLTFRDHNMPEYIEISGEPSKSKIYEYVTRPQICGKYLEFRHEVKYCKSRPDMR